MRRGYGTAVIIDELIGVSDLLLELSQIINALEDNEIEYAVCGGLALTIHGFPRATFDIDILIQEASLATSFEIAKLFGYDVHKLDISFKEQAVEIRSVSKIDDDGEVISLNFLLVTPYVKDVWESKITLEWQDRPISIVSREGLIKMKELAGRHK